MAELGKEWNKYRYSSLFDTSTTNRLLSNAVTNQVMGLSPEIESNFQSLVTKFPNQSFCLAQPRWVLMAILKVLKDLLK
jgi:hypothetical protein